MNTLTPIRSRVPAATILAAVLILDKSASAVLIFSGAFQNPGTASFDPTNSWTVATNSLIAGLAPSDQNGNFTGEANTPGVSALTDGYIGPVSGSLNIYAAGGPSGAAGHYVTYTLPAQANG